MTDALLPTLAMSVAGLALITFLGAKTNLALPALVSYALHLVVGLGYYWLSGLISDANIYDSAAQSWALMLSGDGPGIDFPVGKSGWPWVLALLYHFFGHAPELGLVLCAIMMGIVPIVLGITCRSLSWPSSARPAAWLITLFPPALFWTSLLSRETAAIFLLSLMALSLGFSWQGKQISAVTLLCLSAGLMTWIRPEIGLMGLGGCIIAMLTIHPRSTGFARIAPLVLVLPGLLLALLLLARSQGSDIATIGASIANKRQALGVGANSVTGVSADGFDTPLGTILALLRDLPMATVGPLPWQWDLKYWPLIVDAASWTLIITFCCIAFLDKGAGRRSLALAIPSLLILLAGDAIMGNWGILIRMRTQALPFLVPLAAYGYVTWRQRRVRRRAAVPTQQLGPTIPPRRGFHMTTEDTSGDASLDLREPRVNHFENPDLVTVPRGNPVRPWPRHPAVSADLGSVHGFLPEP